MIKLKDILLENETPDIFVPRRVDDRIERLIGLYIRDGSKGNLRLAGLGLSELPEILKNVSVGKDFYCNGNNLTSLINSPKSVGGDFFCIQNKLTSLEGAPNNINGGYFACNENNLTSLKGAPKTVAQSFYCNYNKLTSLEGAPKFVGHNFICSHNLLISLEGAPEYVDGNFYCDKNPVKFTEKQVRDVCDVGGKIIV
jgi:hypothetical protein